MSQERITYHFHIAGRVAYQAVHADKGHTGQEHAQHNHECAINSALQIA
jgi:hypothetical protein